MHTTRRAVLASLLSLPASLALSRAAAAQTALPLTPSCADHADTTIAQTEGPYYRPEAPNRGDLRSAHYPGEPVVLAGFVMDRLCNPIPGALVEIWHADTHGDYDNSGYGLRGHQWTDDAGRWGFDTIVTSHYAFRTAHYHFRVRRQGGEVLTTQLYVPDHPRNPTDPMFDERLLLTFGHTSGQRLGRFDFVI
jgi:protocatechuate 3,4-dioxygenase beta subunit